MDLTKPLRSVSPGVDSDVLTVLAGTRAPLTGSRVARLAGRSYAQVRHVLHRLVAHGLVDADRYGNAVAYTLNREHVAAGLVTGLADLHATVESRIRALVEGWPVRPDALIAFGSFARRDGDENSDVDLLLVRPDGVDEDAPEWAEQRHELARVVERWTGNRAQVVDLARSELLEAADRGESLVGAVSSDGVVLWGLEPEQLLVGLAASEEVR